MEARTRQKLRWNMKDYLKLRKEELKKRGAKGFTLMEMLIVVAIIAVLIAIAIPIFTSQLENARDATSVANIRSAYAEAQAAYLTQNAGNANTTINWVDNKAKGTIESIDVANVQIESQQANGWSGQGDGLPFDAPDDPGTAGAMTVNFAYGANDTITVTLSS